MYKSAKMDAYENSTVWHVRMFYNNSTKVKIVDFGIAENSYIC